MSGQLRAKPGEKTAPPWVMTFANLMSLLMCFFVLLLSFSELDVLKYKQIAGSMKFAFGVQREIKVREIPKGTSVIAREFSPGKPEPTPLNIVRQQTTDDLRRLLETEQVPANEPNNASSPEPSQEELMEQMVARVEQDAELLKEAFKEQVTNGLIDIATDQDRIIIRIQEQGSFPSGRATLKPGFEPVISEIGNVLSTVHGNIIVAGHTDDLPIATTRCRSNWELSAARAVTVVHHLKKVAALNEHHFLIEGHADSDPLVPNDSPENRARNRRIEVVVIKVETLVTERDTRDAQRSKLGAA